MSSYDYIDCLCSGLRGCGLGFRAEGAEGSSHSVEIHMAKSIEHEKEGVRCQLFSDDILVVVG